MFRDDSVRQRVPGLPEQLGLLDTATAAPASRSGNIARSGAGNAGSETGAPPASDSVGGSVKGVLPKSNPGRARRSARAALVREPRTARIFASPTARTEGRAPPSGGRVFAERIESASGVRAFS